MEIGHTLELASARLHATGVYFTERHNLHRELLRAMGLSTRRWGNQPAIDHKSRRRA